MSILHLNNKLSTSLSFPHGGFSSLDAFIKECINKLNNANNLFKITGYVLDKNLSDAEWSTDATYFGFIKEESIYAYVCIVPFDCARNGYINQQIMPALLRIYSSEQTTIRINSRPVYILDFLETSHTKSQLLSIINYQSVNYNYINMLGIDINAECVSKGVPTSFNSLKDLDSYLVAISRSSSNDYFSLDDVSHKIKMKKTTFKSSSATDYFVSLTNEPYYYFGRLFLILNLALKEKWNIDMSDFSTYVDGTNINVDIILKYIKSIILMEKENMQKI